MIEQPAPAHEHGSTCQCTPELQTGAGTPLLFTEGDLLYDAMLQSIGSARREIRLESYIFADDEIGRRFADAFVDCVARGVHVRLHIDAAGSLFWASRRMERYLRSQGVEVRWFHRWNWRRPLRYNRRNHRKLLVIDEQVAYTGGFNIHRENSRSVYGEGRWRDTHVCLQGELAVEAARLFDAFWRGTHRWSPTPRPNATTVLLPNFGRDGREHLRCTLADMFLQAVNTIHITTPYFVPDRRTQRLLMQAAQRGVDVCLLVPRKNDVRLTRWAARAAYESLLDGGVRIYEYLPRMLHAKTAVVDGTYASIGTANMDYRSLFTNYELNLFTRDSNLCRQLQQQFFADLDEAEPIYKDAWKRRFWGHRLFEFVGWLARKWL